MKRVYSIFAVLLIVTFILPVTASADIGPKPSVVIDFHGLEGKTYYVTILASVKSTGPYSALDKDWSYPRYEEGDEDYDIFLRFVEYQDSDGFYFLQYFNECTQTHRFKWTYYPPQTFKMLIYFPDTDSFIAGEEVYERYAFDSYFTADVTGTIRSVRTSYDFTNEFLSLIVRIVLTIAIELGLALLFGYKLGKQLRYITFVNIVTQVGLNVALNVINYYSGSMAFVIFFVLLEVAIFIAEAILYRVYFTKHYPEQLTRRKPVLYAFVANAASFALGLQIAKWIPGIF